MSNPSKQKGTAAETELLRLMSMDTNGLVRTPPGKNYDLYRPSHPEYTAASPIQLLATRPDYGDWLVTMRLRDFLALDDNRRELNIEVKRYTKFAHHTIFTEKFGR